MAEINPGNIKWIALDAMGGDFAPTEIVKGALIAASNGVNVILVGDENVIRKELGNAGGENLKILHAPESIEMGDHPVRALKQKPDNSLTRAFEITRDGQASVILSAGNSGAMMIASKWVLGEIPGIFRPAIAVPVPTPTGSVVLIDAGVSTDCSPENLFQFGWMGHIYAKHILKIKSPRVALLNIGEEKSKGNIVTQKAYEFLSESGLNFIGNIEGDEIFVGKADVIACDGFVGNIALKILEGTARGFMSVFKKSVTTGGMFDKIGVMLLAGTIKSMKRKMDWREHGGALIMGIKGNVIITHGKSNASSIANALKFASKIAESDLANVVTKEIASNMKKSPSSNGAL
jgi:glycerol-3-phosphate acyltransferase PlsX